MHPSQQLINCFESFFIWKDILDVEFAETDEVILFRINGNRLFFPVGYQDISKPLDRLLASSVNNQVVMHKVTSENINVLNENGYKFDSIPVRDNFEYIYSADSFRMYTGKHLQSKRNFVNFVKKNYNWSFEIITSENITECRDFSQKFSGNESFDGDNDALVFALDNYGKLYLDGGIIRIDGQISALLITSLSEDKQTAAGLFLRADHSLKGIVAILYQEFFKEFSHYRYFNLAEDLGIEGLRKNKLSYYPDYLLELYTVTVYC